MPSKFFAKEDIRFTAKSPLNPSACDYHANMYAVVDNTQVEFENFVSNINEFDGTPHRMAFLFQGDTGCGKTSTINRCLERYKEIDLKKGDAGVAVIVVDLREESFGDASIKSKVDGLVDYLIDSFKQNPFTKLEEFIEEYSTKSSLGLKLRFIQSKLKEHQKQLVILFPKIELDEELKQFLSNYYISDWVLFFETDDPNLVNYAKRNHKLSSDKPLRLFQLGSISPEDAKSFVEVKHETSGSEIKFNVEGVKKYIEQTQERGGATILELELICKKAHDLAVKEDIQEIGFEHLAMAAISQFNPS